MEEDLKVLNSKPKMDEAEELECAKSWRDISHTTEQFAERRASELADEFTRLEVQIATILIAFAGLFLNSFSQRVIGLSFNLLFLTKFTYAAALFFLIASLAMGLLHIKRKEKFWDDHIVKRVGRFNKWFDVLYKDATYKEARAYYDGTSGGQISHSPLWTWVLQTTCLGISIVLLFVLFLVFLIL